MYNSIVFVIAVILSSLLRAEAPAKAPLSSYVERFKAYQTWSEALPDASNDEFITFIEQDTPLANRLRQKWLYELAREKDWKTFSVYFRDKDSTPLHCLALTALYHLGDEKNALRLAKPLWLVGTSQPSECDELFKLLIHSDQFEESLITQRIERALEQRNLALARYLLKQYKKPRLQDINRLNEIYKKPRLITQLNTAPLHDDFYLYGLKRMVSINMDDAIRFWQHVKTKKLLSESQQQSFLAHLALYKAIRDHKDTLLWFSKIKPAFYNEALLDWQIRFAIKHHLWPEVERLIRLNPDKEDASWQYWLARSLEEQKKTTKAHTIYETIAKNRHYYGFLASLRIKKPFHFEREEANQNLERLNAYQPILEEIKTLYQSNQIIKAARIVHDFVLELPRDDKSAFAWWLASQLNWYDKSIYISNLDDDLNNQITLRFPLAHKKDIEHYAKKHHLHPEFIYAIIRQESAFREEITSSAGARGLMQVMPDTAKLVVKKARIPYQGKEELFSAEKNIRIGTAYLEQLKERFKGHPILMAAAYNAGPNQVEYWLNHHIPEQMDIWVETLPWYETRNYLKNVIAFYAVYQHLMQKNPNLGHFLQPI